MSIFVETVYWAVLLSIGAYLIGKFLQDKTHIVLFNPLLFSTVLTILFLLIFDLDYDIYYKKAEYLYYLLTPATVCLAVPLYEQIKLLKNNLFAIIVGISSGVVACLISILGLATIFHLSHEMYITILPKSITAAMAMGISEELGGVPSLTVSIVIMTGITGHILAEIICKIFKIQEPIAKGLAIGSASHAMGTSKAIEMGQIEGAISSLAIAVTGVITVLGASIFSYFR